MTEISQHYVTFYSPGTFVAEMDTHEIDKWDADEAVEMSSMIAQRHGARPYGFRFITRSRGENDMDAKQTDQSPMYFLGGVVQTREEVLAGTDPADRILRSNVESNDWAGIITNTNSYRITQPLNEGDVVLPTPEWAQ
jgi:hypothetical protein